MSNPVKNWRDLKKIHKYLGKTGKLLVWTQVSTPPTGFEYQAPYFVGIIQLDSKEKMPVQIVDCTGKDLKHNLKVRIVVRRMKKPGPNDVIDYAIKATPA